MVERSHVQICCVQDCRGVARPLSSRNQAGACRHAAFGVRRNIGGSVPHPGLCLRDRRAVRGALQGPGPRLHLFSLLQSDDCDVRAAHDRARRRASLPLDRDRHGRGDDGGAGAAEGRRSCGCLQGAVRIVPLRSGGSAAALRHRLDAGRRARSRRLEDGDAAEHQELLPREPDQSDARRARYSRDCRDRACGRRAADRRQCVRDADLAEPARSSARTWLCIPRQNISTARAAASAA